MQSALRASCAFVALVIVTVLHAQSITNDSLVVYASKAPMATRMLLTLDFLGHKIFRISTAVSRSGLPSIAPLRPTNRRWRAAA